MKANLEKNILLICMSTGQNNETFFYEYGNTFWYSGENQLEPGTKHVLEELARQGRKVDKIFVLTTSKAQSSLVYYKDKIAKFINRETCEYKISVPKVKENESEKEEAIRKSKEEKQKYAEKFSEYETKFSAPQLYQKHLADSCEKMFEVVEIPNPNEVKTSKEAYAWMPGVVEKIRELKKEGNVNLFLDMQGGGRTSSFILNAVVDMIQEDGVILEKAYATAFDIRNAVNLIKDETYALQVFDLVSGMDEFISYGKANRFKSYFEFYKKSNGNTTAEEENIVKNIQRISNAISVCDIEGFYKEIKNLKQIMGEYILSENSRNETEIKSENDPIFSSVVQKLQEAYQDITYQDSKENILDSVEVMKWCLDRELYQQALTICESKLPKQMVDDGLITIVNRGQLNQIRKRENKKYQSDNLETYVIKNYRYRVNGKKRPDSLFHILEENPIVKSDYINNTEFRNIITEYFKICDLRHRINHGNSSKQGTTVEAKTVKDELNNFICKYRKLKPKDSFKIREPQQNGDMGNTNENIEKRNDRSDITKYILRYVVPFGFDKSGKIDSYKKIVDWMSTDNNWKEDDWDEFKKDTVISEVVDEDGQIEKKLYGGSDVYDYLKNLYHSHKKNAIGSAWKYKPWKEEGVKKYVYCRKNKSSKGESIKFNVHIKDVGVYLMKTGIGLFWYEVELKDEDGQTYVPNSQTLKLFQNRFKELAKVDGIISEGKDNGKECYIGEWVDGILKREISADVYYYPNRTIKNGNKKIPDKAILYNYIVTTNERKIDEIAYYLTMGYKNSYQYSNDMLKMIARPFKNTRWYAAKEGFGYYIARKRYYRNKQHEESENFIYHDYIPIRMKSDYFLMFIHLLQQSYSIMHMSVQIAENVSAEENGKSEILRNMEEKVNRFLIKNVNASVSHIGHHNEFYSYVEKALKIKEDLCSLNEGVAVLEEILRGRESAVQEKRNEKMQTSFALLTILGILGLPKTLGEFFLMKGFADEAGDLPLNFLQQMVTFVELDGIYWFTLIVFGLVLISSAEILGKWLSETFIPPSVLHKVKKWREQKEEDK